MTGMIDAAPDAAIPATIPTAMPAASPAARRPQIRIDWQRGASLLVEGSRPAAVATALGIPEVRLWRHLRHSLRFRTLIRRAMERQRLLAQIQYGSLQAATMHHALQGEDPDGVALQWLSAEIAPALSTADASGLDPVDRLGETAARFPSQALRKRLAAERMKMDAQVADSRAALTQRLAARPQAAAAAQPDLTATASVSTATAPISTSTTLVSTSTASVSTATASDSTTTAPVAAPAASQATKPASTAPRDGPVMPPRDYGPPRIRRTVVDLTDMDGNLLPGDGAS
jgi:hypothetical protein